MTPATHAVVRWDGRGARAASRHPSTRPAECGPAPSTPADAAYPGLGVASPRVDRRRDCVPRRPESPHRAARSPHGDVSRAQTPPRPRGPSAHPIATLSPRTLACGVLYGEAAVACPPTGRRLRQLEACGRLCPRLAPSARLGPWATLPAAVPPKRDCAPVPALTKETRHCHIWTRTLPASSPEELGPRTEATVRLSPWVSQLYGGISSYKYSARMPARVALCHLAFTCNRLRYADSHTCTTDSGRLCKS
jgi:hypothetical protein